MAHVARRREGISEWEIKHAWCQKLVLHLGNWKGRSQHAEPGLWAWTRSFICRAQCELKMWGSFDSKLKVIKNFKTVTTEH